MSAHRNAEIPKIKGVMEEFCKKLETRVKRHPHDFFFEDDVRCVSWLILYRILSRKKMLRRTKGKKETRLVANFDPQLITLQYDNRNILDRQYDLAILDDKTDSVNLLCAIEFKFRIRYINNGKIHGATFGSFRDDYAKLKNKDDRTPIKYGILVQIDIPVEESGEIKRYVEKYSGKNNVILRYFYNETARSEKN